MNKYRGALSIKAKSYAITMKENIIQEINAAAKELGILGDLG